MFSKMVELKVPIAVSRIYTGNGSSLKGYLPIGTTYKQVVKLFGPPTCTDTSVDGKVTCMWTGVIAGVYFTIYDYKSKVHYKENIDWHIGGHTDVLPELVMSYYNKVIRRMK